MKGNPREVAEHKLNIKPGSKPVKQHLCHFNNDKCKAIGEEIQKLLSAGFIREVFHPEWLANPVLVKKKNKKWRMCVDYTSLNKACPKDMFPLPRIDQVVDSVAGCETLYFLERSLPLYKLMKKSDHFTWTPEAQEALDSLKNILKSPPILSAPTIEEPMFLYISATTQVVSAALVVEREEPGRSQKIQRPVYFISEVLSDSKTRYSQMQKLVYVILMTKRKL
jgi:hypothetical protein